MIYILKTHPSINHDILARAIASELGCTDYVPLWHGISILPDNCLAVTHFIITPPAGAHIIDITSLEQLQQLADDLHSMTINPPHIDHIMQCISAGVSNSQHAAELAEYIDTLRERTYTAEQRP